MGDGSVFVVLKTRLKKKKKKNHLKAFNNKKN